MINATDDMVTTDDNAETNSTYLLFIIGISILAILGWIGIYVLPLSEPAKRILIAIDSLMSLVFLYDFLHNFATASSKKAYLKWGWADLLSSIPNFPFLRIFRLVSIIRVQQILRRTSSQTIGQTFRKRRGESALLSSVFALFILILFGSLFVLNSESKAPGSNIINADDAVWWAMVTMTTVGYGDLFPVTNSGRIVGLVLMTAGVAVVGVLTGYLTNYFAQSTTSQDQQDQRLDKISEELAEIRRLLQEKKQQNSGGKAVNSN